MLYHLIFGLHSTFFFFLILVKVHQIIEGETFNKVLSTESLILINTDIEKFKKKIIKNPAMRCKMWLYYQRYETWNKKGINSVFKDHHL